MSRASPGSGNPYYAGCKVIRPGMTDTNTSVQTWYLGGCSAGMIEGPGGYCIEASAKTAGACPSNGQSASGSSCRGGIGNPIPGVGNPIHPFTGNKYQIDTDYVGSGVFPLRFDRVYNSSSAVGHGRMGAKWRHFYDRYLSVFGPNAVAMRADGKQYAFTQSGGNWVGLADVMGRLETIGGGGWRYIGSEDEIETYDAKGRLTSIANRSGVTHILGYDAAERLVTVTHSASTRVLTLSYDGSNRVSSLTDPASNVISYGMTPRGTCRR